MPAQRLPTQAAEDVGEGAHAELSRRTWCQLEAAAVALKVAGLLQCPCELAELVQVFRGLVAAQVPQQLRVEPVEALRIARRQQLLLHLVVLLLPVDRCERIDQAHRLVTREGIRLAEGRLGPHRLQVAGEACHVPAQPVVAQQVVHHLM